MNNYEKIKRACQIANPRLLELSFGCEVIYGSDEYEPRPVTIGNPYQYTFGRIVNPWNTDDSDELFEILGHEPQLFDIKTMMEYNGHAVEQNFLDIVQNWNYPDRLSDQSDVTIKLILPYVQKNG